MHLASIEERVEELIQPEVEKLGYELYDVEYAKEGKDYFLRIFIDKSKGIDLEDCEIVNNAINELLDTADYIKQQYFLEVSSPGIERTLRKDRHLKENIEKEVVVNLFQAINGKKQIEGKLVQFDFNSITLQTNEQDVVIERKSISLIKTKYNW